MAVPLHSVPTSSVPVYAAPARIDHANVDEVRADLELLAIGHRAIAIDCAQLESIGGTGVRALEQVAHDTEITLVDPAPILRLMVAVFGLDVTIRTRRGRES